MKKTVLIGLSYLCILPCFGQRKIKEFKSFSKSKYESIPLMDLTRYKSVKDRGGQEPDLLVGITLSGGGSRAQFFSLGVLMGLEEIKYKESNVLKETDFFSTVSGGGLAAGVYYRFLVEKNTPELFINYMDKLGDNMPIVNIPTPKHKLFINPFGKYKKYVTVVNRAVFNREKNDYKGLYFHEIMPLNSDTATVKYPFIIPNTAVYSNGDLFQFVPDVLIDKDIVEAYKGERKRRKWLYHGFFVGYPLAFGIAVSSTFPRMLPHQNLYNSQKESITVFDGGLNDNLGVISLQSVFNQESNIKKKLAIVVNSSASGANSPYADPKGLRLFKFLKKSALYPVDLNVQRNKTNLNTLFKNDSHVYLELSEFNKKSIIDINNPEIGSLTSASKKYKTKKLYKILLSSLDKKSLVVDNKISNIPSTKFSELSDFEKFLIFEIAANKELGLKIKDHHLNCLILAGRMMVYENRKDIEDKLK